MTSTRRSTTSASDILRRRLLAGHPERQQDLERERVNADIAQMLYDMRKQAGLTQKELASRVGTATSVISRLEDADYAGHSLTMLQRIAAALDLHVEVRFVSADRACETPSECSETDMQLA